MLKISVIITVYNGAQYIAKAISSVLSQDFQNYEIIVINDCSTDNTIDILNDFVAKNSCIKLYSNEKNYGAGPSRNFAIKKSIGEYILILDSDDKLHDKSVLEKLYKFAKSNKSDVVQFDYEIYNESIKKCRIRRNILLYKRNKIDLSNCTLASICRFYNRRYILEKNIEYGMGNFAEDHNFVIRALLESKKINYLPEICYTYTERSNSLTNSAARSIKKPADYPVNKSIEFKDFFNNVKNVFSYLASISFYERFANKYLIRSLKAKLVTLSENDKKIFLELINNYFSLRVVNKLESKKKNVIKWIFSIKNHKDQTTLVKTKTITIFGFSFTLSSY